MSAPGPPAATRWLPRQLPTGRMRRHPARWFGHRCRRSPAPGQGFLGGEHGTRTPLPPPAAQGCSSATPSHDAARGFPAQTPGPQPNNPGVREYPTIFTRSDSEVIQLLGRRVPGLQPCCGAQGLVPRRPQGRPRDLAQARRSNPRGSL